MKKLVLVLISLVTMNLAFAQTYVGVQIGANKNRFWGDNAYGKYHNAITCPSFGAVLNKGITKQLTLSTGIHYEITGSGMNDLYFEAPPSGSNNFVRGDLRTELTYLTIPVMANYDFGNKKLFGLGGGFFASYLLSAKNKFKYKTANFGLPEESTNNEYEDFNYGMNANVHYRLNLSQDISLVFLVEDHFGLNNLENDLNEKRKTNSVGVYASFLIGLK